MKKLIVLLALVPMFCSAQTDTAWRTTPASHSPSYQPIGVLNIHGTADDLPGINPSTGETGRTRTINYKFITIYSPTEYKGYCIQKEVVTNIAGVVSVRWVPVTYFRYVPPFKKRKDYSPSEIYIP